MFTATHANIFMWHRMFQLSFIQIKNVAVEQEGTMLCGRICQCICQFTLVYCTVESFKHLVMHLVGCIYQLAASPRSKLVVLNETPVKASW